MKILVINNHCVSALDGTSEDKVKSILDELVRTNSIEITSKVCLGGPHVHISCIDSKKEFVVDFWDDSKKTINGVIEDIFLSMNKTVPDMMIDVSPAAAPIAEEASTPKEEPSRIVPRVGVPRMLRRH